MAKAIEGIISKNDLQLKGLEYTSKKGVLMHSEGFSLLKYNGVHIEFINGNRKALCGYLTKYVSKNDEVFDTRPYHCSRCVSALFTGESFRNVNDGDFSLIKNTLSKITTIFKEFEFFKIQYCNVPQSNGKFFNPPDLWYAFRDWVNDQVYSNFYLHRFERFSIY